MGKTYFTADTHFGQERTRQFSFRPFSDIVEMDTKIIEEWNKVVTDEDTVIINGDFGIYDRVSKLNGRKVLVLGNYELTDLKEGRISEKELIDMGFDSLHLSLNWVDPVTNKEYIIKHKPLEGKLHCFANISGVIYAHIHRLQTVKKWNIGEKTIYGLNVGVDCNHFRLWSEDEIRNQFDVMEKGFYDEEVWC